MQILTDNEKIAAMDLISMASEIKYGAITFVIQDGKIIQNTGR